VQSLAQSLQHDSACDWENGKWHIEPDGVAYFNGARVEDEFNLYEVDGVLKRHDGWEVDMAASHPKRLLWKKEGEADVGRVPRCLNQIPHIFS